jgi:hypothetical protein
MDILNRVIYPAGSLRGFPFGIDFSRLAFKEKNEEDHKSVCKCPVRQSRIVTVFIVNLIVA